MPQFTKHAPGTFSWPELSTTDQKAAVAFYRGLFGWGVDDQPMGPNDMYSIFQLERIARRRRVHDAARRAADGAPPHWNAYVTVENVEAATKRAQELGATVICAAVRCDGSRPHGGAAGSDGRDVSGVAGRQEHRCAHARRAGRALLDGTHDQRPGSRRERSTRRCLAGPRNTPRRIADAVHRALGEGRGQSQHRHDGQAAAHAAGRPVVLAAVFPGNGRGRVGREGKIDRRPVACRSAGHPGCRPLRRDRGSDRAPRLRCSRPRRGASREADDPDGYRGPSRRDVVAGTDEAGCDAARRRTIHRARGLRRLSDRCAAARAVAVRRRVRTSRCRDAPQSAERSRSVADLAVERCPHPPR